MKYIKVKNLARKCFPCKIFQGKHFLARSFKENISLQDLSRNKFPCKILQVIAFLQESCKILARNAFFLDQGSKRIPFLDQTAATCVVTLTYDVNKFLRVPVWQTNSYNWNFFQWKIFFHGNHWNRQYLTLFGFGKTKTFPYTRLFQRYTKVYTAFSGNYFRTEYQNKQFCFSKSALLRCLC